MDDKEMQAKELAELLESGEMEKDDPAEKARAVLPPKYEIRIPAKRDPVAEETVLYRRLAKEVDGRYDKYTEHAKEDADGNEPERE